MKKFLFFFLFTGSSVFSQQIINLSFGAKPQISINGDTCSILNQQFSCVPRNCNDVTIFEGDSITFCTEANIDLQTDTAYYMKWKFTGCSNFPDSVMDYTQTNLPKCYKAVWNSAGNDTVHIYYNGFLSAYPASDCYPVPSHWIIAVTVLQLNPGIDESTHKKEIIFPNPASEEFTVELNYTKGNLEIYSLLGEKINSFELLNGENKINIEEMNPGIYFCKIISKEKISLEKIVVMK